MNDNKNFILAIGLSMLILVIWQVFVIAPREEERRAIIEQQQAIQQANEAATAGDAAVGAPSPDGLSSPSATQAPIAQGIQTIEAATASDTRVKIDTPSLTGSINLVGGRLDDILLKGYQETIDDSSPLIRLLHPTGTENAYFTETGFVAPAGGAKVPDGKTVWAIDGNNTLSVNNDVAMKWDNGAGITFTRTFSVDENYMFTVTDKVDNTTSEAVSLFPYGYISRRGRPETTGIYILHEGPLGVFGEQGLVEVDYDDLEELADGERISEPSATNGWLGITDKYWATTLIPPHGLPFKGSFAHSPRSGTNAYQADFLSDAITIAAGASGQAATQIFAGAKKVSIIDGYKEQFNIDKYEKLIDWGWFHFLTRPMFYALDWLFKLVGNFGVAILLLTIVVKAIFFPLASKSYKSMSRMKLIQPKMKDLQDRFKEDKPRLQQEMMKLYKDEKVNPLAGCWPVLIQIPVFFALYKVLFVTLEMRHAPFFGWIEDLAASDPTSIFNLFGLLPFTPPEWIPVLGIWPLIMGVTMFIQMKLNPAPPDPTQQFIFNWMPVIFTIMLASFPAGLVIYWAWNNTLSVLQQYTIMKGQGVDVDIIGNIMDTFRKKKPKEVETESGKK